MAAEESMVPISDDGGAPAQQQQQQPQRRQLSRGGGGSSHGSSANLDIHHDGDENTLEYRIRTTEKDESGAGGVGVGGGGVANTQKGGGGSGSSKGKKKKEISLWHDITLVHIDPATDRPTPYLNFVCEIPKFSRKKYEIATDEIGNPIKQDEKKGKLREFKKGDIFFNYGCLPRTWEDPTHVHPDAEGCRGDNDPLDVCDIGLRIVKPGEVRPVKILGILCMIDEGEADWKLVVVDAQDKWAPFLNDIADVDKHLPGQLDAIREWFRTYKIPDGKPPNVFGLEERFMDKAYALEIIKECNASWKALITGEKERTLERHDESVQKLVRKLSKSNLVDLASSAADGDDEPPTF